MLFDGRRIWILTVIDTWSRVCPVMRVCCSATAMEVIDALEQTHRQYGLPRVIRVDQGTQFTSKELDLWAYTNGVTLDFSRPGKPTEYGSSPFMCSRRAISGMATLRTHRTRDW